MKAEYNGFDKTSRLSPKVFVRALFGEKFEKKIAHQMTEG